MVRWPTEVARLWTGSANDSAWAALHRADETMYLAASDGWVKAEGPSIKALAQAASAWPPTGQYASLLGRLRRDGAVSEADREVLRVLRRADNDAWELAKARVLILRNILTCASVLLVAVLTGMAAWGAADPGIFGLRAAGACAARAWAEHGDVLVVELFGALGGLVSSIFAVSALRQFRRAYGLPLAQLLLKVPMGAVVALLAVLLMQHGVVTALSSIPWSAVPIYAAVFGFGQVAVTRSIDAQANRLAAMVGEAARSAPSPPPAPGAAVSG